MKKYIHTLSLILGLLIGFTAAESRIFFSTAVAAEGETKEKTYTEEEINKRLDELLESQKALKTRVDGLRETIRVMKIAAARR